MEFLAFLKKFSFLKIYKLGQPIRNVHKDHVT